MTEKYPEPESIQEIHKTDIQNIRKKYQHNLSSHAFPSLYLWQHTMGLSIICDTDFFVVKCRLNGTNAWFFPCGNRKKTYDFIQSHMADPSFSLCYMRDEDVSWLNECFPHLWTYAHTEDCDEYICDIEEYLTMSGKHFSEIRRKIRKLESTYRLCTQIITDQNRKDAFSVIDDWNTTAHTVSKKNLTDELVAETALSHMDFLNVNGVIVYADAKPAAVFAGFPLSDDTVDVLIGKCTPNAPRGFVYYSLREYLKLCCSDYIYCNHEEDLGIEGIRQIKNSLCPIRKTRLWEARLK